MPYPQSTLEEIVDSERAMFVDAAARYAQHYTHARDTTMLLSNCIVRIEKKDRSRIFGQLFSLMKKQHTLAFLSILRLHRVQAMMNLRQVLEAAGRRPMPSPIRSSKTSSISMRSGSWTRLRN